MSIIDDPLAVKHFHQDAETEPSGQEDRHTRLRRYASILNNLGCLLVQEGDILTAMQILQESVQALMLIEDPANETMPSEERQEEMANKLKEVMQARRSDILTCSSVKKDEETDDENGEQVKSAFKLAKVNVKVEESTGETTEDSAVEDREKSKEQPTQIFTELKPRKFALQGIPGLFGMPSSIKGSENTTEGFSMLSFSEPFLVELDVDEHKPLDDVFYVPIDQCAKASLFNMGLIHYQWKSLDSAVHFFELSMSLSKLENSLAFDPIRLAGMNNIGQIILQNRKSEQAKEVFRDAYFRAKCVLDQMNLSQRSDSRQTEAATRKIVLRFVARSLMNAGWVHFFNCDYSGSIEPLKEAFDLLKDDIEDLESAALFYNMGLANHHQNERKQALIYLKKFLNIAYRIIGLKHEQVAAALHRKSIIYLERGNVYDSIPTVLIAIRIRKGLFGHFHPLVAESLSHFGKIYLDREEFDFAISAFLQALEAQRGLQNDGMSLDIAQTLIDLGRAYHAQGNLKESLKAYLEVLLLTKKVFGEKHPYAARIQNILGNIYLEQGKVPEAVCMFTEAVRIHFLHGIPLETKVVQNPLCKVELDNHSASAFA